MRTNPVVIVGAGPAGLTAAYALGKRGIRPIVLEKAGQVGGLARTEEYKGYRFDIGGHRFFTKVGEVETLWHEVLGSDFIEVPRLSRIYYRGKFFTYPLNLRNTIENLGPVESTKILLSYLKAKLRTPYPNEKNLEEWVINRFGERLYHTFFKTYTEKVWGLSCTRIRTDWAAQRIQSLSVKRAVLNAFFKNGDASTLITKFLYPVYGPGMMWERFTERVEAQGGEVRLNTEVLRLCHKGGRIEKITARNGTREYEQVGTHFINTMPITHLMCRLDPAPPAPVVEAAKRLLYRDFIVVALIVDRTDLFPDNWIYIHSPEVQVGRIQNFKNWSVALVPDASKTCVGMEYFCTNGDGLWTMSDEDLIQRASRELAEIGLANEDEVIDGTVIRQAMAYPVYDETYKENLAVIRDYLATFENLQTVGRAGMHRYNNQDHSMLTAMLAVENLLGEAHDLWEVNVERSYHEDFTVSEKADRTARETAHAYA